MASTVIVVRYINGLVELVKGSSGVEGTTGTDLLDVITITGTLILEEQTFITKLPMSLSKTPRTRNPSALLDFSSAEPS